MGQGGLPGNPQRARMEPHMAKADPWFAAMFIVSIFGYLVVTHIHSNPVRQREREITYDTDRQSAQLEFFRLSVCLLIQ